MQNHFDAGREMLKWMAIATMTIDHIGAILYKEYTILRIIGRVSFPLFSYLIALGVSSTRDLRKYVTRLFLLALASQIPFTLAISSSPIESLNIFFTLSSGVIFIYFYRKKSILILVPTLASILLNFDYSIYGILLIGSMYVLRENTESGVAFIILLNLLFLPFWPTQAFSLLALPLILLHKKNLLLPYRKKKGTYPNWRKLFFYIYYPIHLIVIYLIGLEFF